MGVFSYMVECERTKKFGQAMPGEILWYYLYLIHSQDFQSLSMWNFKFNMKCDTITQTEMNFVMHCRNHDLLWYFLLELLGKIWHWNLFPGKPPTDSSSLASKLSKGGEEAVSQSSADYNRHLSALNNSVSQWINVCWTSWIATGLLEVHPNSHILLMLDRTMYLRTRCVIWLQYFLITKNTWQKSMISSVSRTKKIRKASSL